MNIAPPRAVKALMAESWRASRDIPPRLGEITLAPHQREAVARVLDLLDEHGGAVLADEAGMGKTFVALAVASTLRGFVAVAPAALRDTWHRAFARAGVAGRFLSFESLSRGAALVDEVVPLVIVDEAHHARNPRTRRYAALARLTWGARVLLLTATPVHNRLRDLRSQLALFLGARALTSGRAELGRLVVRRRHGAMPLTDRLPDVEPLQWLSTPASPAVLRAILDLPPAVPPADGGEAHSLLRLGLVRAWTSSAAALRAALAHRRRQAAALAAALEAGRFPTRRELGAWTEIDGALQLAFPELVAALTLRGDAEPLRIAISSHAEGVRLIQEAVVRSADPDGTRAEHLRRIRVEHAGARIVAFTHYVATARELFGRLLGDGAVALVTAQGARIASGRVHRRDVLEQFSPGLSGGARRANHRLTVELLLATDVLSEGLDLQQASVLVHLDLPWTAARLEQRLGRVRRMGSPHDRVHVYAVGPPPRARELATVVRALQRKLRLVTSLVGMPDAAALDETLGGVARRRSQPDLAAATERVRGILDAWCRAAPGCSAANDVALAVRHAGTGHHAWQALALVATATRRRLVVLDPDDASEHPERILAFLRAEHDATDVAGDCVTAHDALHCAHTAAQRWLAERRGAHAIDAAVEAPSSAHAGVLRWLARGFTRASRHQRPLAAERTARCRALLLNARGAGAEEFLIHWLNGQRARDPGRNAEREIESLMTTLERRSSSRPAAPGAAPALLALLVLVHRARTRNAPAAHPAPRTRQDTLD